MSARQWPEQWRTTLAAGDRVAVSRDTRADFDDRPAVETFDAVVTFVGRSGVVVHRGADGNGDRDVVAYEDLREPAPSDGGGAR